MASGRPKEVKGPDLVQVKYKRRNPVTVAVTGFLHVLRDQFRYTLKMSDFKGWSGFSLFQPLLFSTVMPNQC